MCEEEITLRNTLRQAKLERKKLDNKIEDIVIELTRLTYVKYMTNNPKLETKNMRKYREEINTIKTANHKDFEFDVYKINEFEEWKKIKTVKLIDYQKKLVCGGSSGIEIFHRKNGRTLDLVTIEVYDIYMNPEIYGLVDLDKKLAYSKQYITLETLNTILYISEKEDWNFST